jgi:hypothetical protein
MHRLAPVVLLPLALSAGCDLSAKPYAGTLMAMTITGAGAQMPGQHLEMWARNQYNDTIRVNGIFDTTVNGKDTRLFPYGIVLRPAVTMDDPCMIDTTTGAWLIKAEAYKDSNAGGVHQTPEEQAQSVRSRISQVTATSSCDGSPESKDPVTKPFHCGQQQNTIIGTIAYELVDNNGMVTAISAPGPTTCETSGNAAGCIPFDAAPADRLAACSAYWASSPLAYSPNPLQITAPIRGQLYGEVTYGPTIVPPSQFDQIRVESPVNLVGIQEFWYTVEQDQLDVPPPMADRAPVRGPVFLDGTPDEGGMSFVHFDLSPPFGSMATVSGTAAMLVDIESDPIQF